MPYARGLTVQSRQAPLALGALFVGALAIAWAGILVRLSETGPTATAFWRGALALPFLAAWAWFEPDRGATRFDRALLWCGLLFAADLYVWHLALLQTSVAAATLEGNLAPVFVMLFAWLLYRERPTLALVAALALAFAGVALIVAPKLGGGGGALVGDALGVATAVFYGGYLLLIGRIRANRGTGNVMFWSTLVFTVALLPIALTEKFLPDSARGFAVLFTLAFVAQFFGQGLIAWALAHLPATFGAIGLYVQPIAAAFYAWWLFGEMLTGVQLAGALIVFAAIALARREVPMLQSRR
jgi:drug/metabolite transporter (DMT)-like permease